MIHEVLINAFNKYSQTNAPFMHQQFAEWSTLQPLAGLKVLHHVPLVANTLLKISCLVAAGAEVTVTNPHNFCHAQPEAISCLNKAQIPYVENLETLANTQFDLFFDCGAELYQILGKPSLGAIELTGSGDNYYRQKELDFPVISIDRSLTKQLETVFGCAESSHQALKKLTHLEPSATFWLIFGFGKIGRGLAYFCYQNKVPVMLVDTDPLQRTAAQQLGIKAIDPQNISELECAFQEANVIATSTGQKAIMSKYPKTWFKDKILANLGVYDEFGPQFSAEEVLNNKMPINFVLHDPTPMKYIDPEFYIHNLVALSFLQEQQLAPGVHGITSELDQKMIHQWCAYHGFPLEIIQSWFIK